ncbi:hypothetical protein ACFVHW_04130 [Streptomyces sp. NPDC127110]|uniref:hypothetical protein n=1 Tax=Streptomyces sp. NPDC127110 TaxID=3345362 RepID=UPI0036263939
MPVHKDIRFMLKAARQQGFSVKQGTRGSHMRVVAADGRWVTVPGTPSDMRGFANIRAKLRKLGVQL